MKDSIRLTAFGLRKVAFMGDIFILMLTPAISGFLYSFYNPLHYTRCIVYKRCAPSSVVRSSNPGAISLTNASNHV